MTDEAVEQWPEHLGIAAAEIAGADQIERPAQSFAALILIDRLVALCPQGVDLLDRLAEEKKVSKAQVALAWVLSQNDEIVTIPGTRKIHRLEENLGAFKVELSKTDLATIQNSMPSETIGNRY